MSPANKKWLASVLATVRNLFPDMGQLVTTPVIFNPTNEGTAMNAKISRAQANTLIALRSLPNDADRKEARKEVFKAIKEQFGIPAEVKIKVEVDNQSSPTYLVVKNKYNEVFPLRDVDGKWTGAPAPTLPERRSFVFSVDALTELMQVNDESFHDGDVEPDPSVPTLQLVDGNIILTVDETTFNG